ncbi:HalOD1 output domain-containing protein [Haloarchaeobius litoreus]|uniref:HalOD1 output domain-containing protein n=1 Tax=Haloarchaeobius litoreus TaxID=755306 RepID=A0ABD6DNB0_9EURY|nr:HalOD1 output domain-containing protein [Haloarchaeobius litoreus]
MSIDDTDPSPQESPGFHIPNLQYQRESDCFLYTVDHGRWSMCEAVVSSVAAATGRDPLGLPQLYDAIDPDALDALLSPAPDPGNDRSVSVSFEYADCRVSIEGESRIRVRATAGVASD